MLGGLSERKDFLQYRSTLHTPLDWIPCAGAPLQGGFLSTKRGREVQARVLADMVQLCPCGRADAELPTGRSWHPAGDMPPTAQRQVVCVHPAHHDSEGIRACIRI